jgi:hypothetical protein
MPSKRKKETEVEKLHGHCADLLMDDYGIQKEFRAEICEEIQKIWKQYSMIHCLIIISVRGYQPNSATRPLERYLQNYQTHPPKNHNPTSYIQ